MKSVLIIGGGGHTRVLIDSLRCEGRAIEGVFSKSHPSGSERFGVRVLGGDEYLEHYKTSEYEVVIGVGSIDVSSTRAEIYNRVKDMGFDVASVIHPTVILAADVKLDEGVQLMAGAILQPGVSIGVNSVINTRACIDHDVLVGEHSHVAPGVICSGSVNIGNSVHVGVGAVLVQGVTIGDRCMIAAGSVVVGSLLADSKVKGVPAKSFGSTEVLVGSELRSFER